MRAHAVRWALLLTIAACAERPAPLAPRVVAPTSVAPPPIVVDTAPPPPADDDEWMPPCKQGTPEHKAASAALDAMSKTVGDLPLTGDPAPVEEKLHALVETPCFASVGIANELALHSFTSALSLKTFWHDGAESALSARLEWDAEGGRTYWVGPSIRSALTKERAGATHPLLPLLCPAAASGCGAETAGWVLRATHAMHAMARADRASFLDASPPGEPPKTHATCIKEAKGVFTELAECMADVPVKEDALPLGAFHAPTSGWLVLRGRRGHYSWCNELRAYDLATGSAYIAKTCGGMSAAKGTPPSFDVERGKVSAEALREAAWMMFLAPLADHAVIVRGEGHDIPPEIPIRIPKKPGLGLRGSSGGWSSGRTTLVYQWIRGGKSAATGTVDWPDSYRAIDDYASQLLASAEAGFTKTCGLAALPAIPWSARSDKATRVGSASSHFPAYDTPDFDDLERELTRVAKTPCAVTP